MALAIVRVSSGERFDFSLITPIAIVRRALAQTRCVVFVVAIDTQDEAHEARDTRNETRVTRS